jgi:cobalamin biosynthesis Mg chelatase CobN
MSDVITQGEIPDPRTLLVKLEALEKTQILFREDITRVPTSVQEATKNLRELMEAKMELISQVAERERKRIEDVSEQRFARIDAGLMERDKRADQLALANSAALAAALAAQKEAAGEAQKSSALAISKSETATSESIKQGQTLNQTGLNSLILQVNDLKSRMDKGEGGSQQKSESGGNMIAIIAVLAAVALVAVDLGAIFISRGAH